jgi:hypothetical protein
MDSFGKPNLRESLFTIFLADTPAGKMLDLQLTSIELLRIHPECGMESHYPCGKFFNRRGLKIGRNKTGQEMNGCS